jgi:hypothetical protein
MIISAFLLLSIAACQPLNQPAVESAPQNSTESVVGAPSAEAASPEPVYDPAQVGDLQNLKSYIISEQGRHQKGTEPIRKDWEDWQSTISVITEFHQATLVTTYRESATADTPESIDTYTDYLVGSIDYSPSSELGDTIWTVMPVDETLESYFNPFKDEFAYIKSARFVGAKDYKGIPAYHFVFDQTDWMNPDPEDTLTVESAQGSFFLSQEGNYPLHLDYKIIGNVWWEWDDNEPDGGIYVSGIEEASYDVSSIDQVEDLNFPSDLPVQVSLDPTDVPLPPNTELDFIALDSEISPLYSYYYVIDMSLDDIASFYQELESTNGWAVSNVSNDEELLIVDLEKNGKELQVTAYVDDSYGLCQIYFDILNPTINGNGFNHGHQPDAISHYRNNHAHIHSYSNANGHAN